MSSSKIKGFLNTKEYFFAIARGLVAGTTFVNKFGENPDIDSAAEDIWDLGGAYVFSTTAAIDSISSSNNSDTVIIRIEGLDENWLEITQNITLSGQTRVALTTPLIRVNRAFNIGSSSVLGNVHIYENTALTGGIPTDTTKSRAAIRDGNNQTLMAIYSVPADKTGYLLDIFYTFSRDKSSVTADLTWRKQEFNQKFRVQQRVSLLSSGTSNWGYKYDMPVTLPPKTDVKVRCESVSTINTSLAAGFSIILIEDT